MDEQKIVPGFHTDELNYVRLAAGRLTTARKMIIVSFWL